MSWWSHKQAPAGHVRREYQPPQALGETMRRYALATELPSNHGVDPFREAARRAAFANGPLRISPIAQAVEPLKHNATAVSDRRRVWRFRACDLKSGRCMFEQYVESETYDGAVEEGRKALERVAIRRGIGTSQALVGSVLAV